MLSQELDSVIHGVSISTEITTGLKNILVENLKSCRDTARVLEEKITIKVSEESSSVKVFDENAGIPSA